MKRYRPLTETFDHLITYKGRNVFDNRHSVEEYKKHFPNLDMPIYVKALKQGIDKILSEYKDEEYYYIIRSKKYGFGIQLDWRPDRHSRDNKNHGYTATTLGKDETKFYTRNDRVIFVEQIKKRGVKKLNESKIYRDVIDLKAVEYFRLNPPIHIKEDMKGYDVFIESGIINRTFNILEVD